MNTKARILLTTSALLLAVVSSTPALAWGCIAVSEEGSYGYSYNYSDQSEAADRALEECAAKTTTSSTCEITECNED